MGKQKHTAHRRHNKEEGNEAHQAVKSESSPSTTCSHKALSQLGRWGGDRDPAADRKPWEGLGCLGLVVETEELPEHGDQWRGKEQREQPVLRAGVFPCSGCVCVCVGSSPK